MILGLIILGVLQVVLYRMNRIDLEKMERKIMVTLDDIVADVTEEKSVIQGAVTLLGQLSQMIKDAGTDPVKLQAVKDLIDSNKADLAAAVVANTPAAPPPAP